MKKIAAILLFVFALAQAGSTLSSVFSINSKYLLLADEKKNDSKTEKEKSDLLLFSEIPCEFIPPVNIDFLLAENIQLPPLLEKVSPPPNFS